MADGLANQTKLSFNIQAINAVADTPNTNNTVVFALTDYQHLSAFTGQFKQFIHFLAAKSRGTLAQVAANLENQLMHSSVDISAQASLDRAEVKALMVQRLELMESMQERWDKLMVLRQQRAQLRKKEQDLSRINTDISVAKELLESQANKVMTLEAQLVALLTEESGTQESVYSEEVDETDAQDLAVTKIEKRNTEFALLLTKIAKQAHATTAQAASTLSLLIAGSKVHTTDQDSVQDTPYAKLMTQRFDLMKNIETIWNDLQSLYQQKAKQVITGSDTLKINAQIREENTKLTTLIASLSSVELALVTIYVSSAAP